VRTEHVHAVVTVPPATSAAQAMTSLKAWATRRLLEGDALPPGRPPWSRHGSTRHITSVAGLAAACRYVLEEQGPPLAGER
jgi:REP element-mobilizing transposase RayT